MLDIGVKPDVEFLKRNFLADVQRLKAVVHEEEVVEVVEVGNIDRLKFIALEGEESDIGRKLFFFDLLY